MGLPEAIDWRDTPEEIRRHYQYFTEARMYRIVQAGYTLPATTLELGIACYIRDYLVTDDPYR